MLITILIEKEPIKRSPFGHSISLSKICIKGTNCPQNVPPWSHMWGGELIVFVTLFPNGHRTTEKNPFFPFCQTRRKVPSADDAFLLRNEYIILCHCCTLWVNQVLTVVIADPHSEHSCRNVTPVHTCGLESEVIRLIMCRGVLAKVHIIIFIVS